MVRVKHRLLIAGLTALFGRSVSAVETGRAAGTFTLDSSSSTLASAACYEGEDLYDSSRKNTMVVLTDVAPGDVPVSADKQRRKNYEKSKCGIDRPDCFGVLRFRRQGRPGGPGCER